MKLLDPFLLVLVVSLFADLGAAQESPANADTVAPAPVVLEGRELDVLRLQQLGACQPSWLPTFGRFPGTNGDVRALTVFDDGSGGGQALYVGGNFTSASGVLVSDIAKWDGDNWQPLGSGVSALNGAITVEALTVFDDGSGGGPALFVGGEFTKAGGVQANYIAKWDGTTWSPLGSGVVGRVNALTVYDDGSGPNLYVGGFFTSSSVPKKSIAKWDGTFWRPLGTGMNDEVMSLAVFDDGSGGGPALYAGGFILQAGASPAFGIAKWDSSQWSSLGNGMAGPVSALTVFDDGSGGGSALYAAGSFTGAGGVLLNRIGKWDGASWFPLGNGMNFDVYALDVFDDGLGGGPALYAAGQFTSPGNHIGKWDGNSWTNVGGGTNQRVFALEVFDNGSGPALYAGGFFASPAKNIAKWDGLGWSSLGTGMSNPVFSLEVFDDGGGPALYAGGKFVTAGGVEASMIAKWDGSSWSPLGSGTNDRVLAMTVFDDGSGGGPSLYAAGDFTMAGQVSANRIAKWDGTSWSRLLAGMNGSVSALEVFDDGRGSGPALYVGGSFTIAGVILADRIAKWNGTSWSKLGSGVSGGFSALEVFDDGSGSGPALIAGGAFSISASGDSYLAKWGCPTSPPFTGFCTAKTTLVCGAANISATGTPSATATSGFVIEAHPVRGCRPGLLLHSNQLTQPGASFGGPGNGLLCLSGMGLRRAGPIQSNTAMQQCEGTLAIDMNQFNTSNWMASGCNPPLGQSNPAGFLSGMGTTVNAQMWGRDSIASGQVLSDGISWAVGP